MSLFSVFLAWMLLYFGRRFIAYTLCSHIFSHICQHPARHQLVQRFSVAIDGYCNMLTVLAELAVVVLGFQSTGSQVIPGAWPSDEKPTRGENEYELEGLLPSSLEHSNAEGGSGAFGTEMKSTNHDLGESNLSQAVTSCGLYIDSPYSSAPELVAVPVKGRVRSKDVHTTAVISREGIKHGPLPLSPKLIHKVDYPSKVTATLGSTPNPSATKKHERSQKYARMRTLKLPGRQMRPMKAPTETMLALRRIDEELAIEESKLDTHCARELAGDGIFTQLPTTQSQRRTTSHARATCRTRRETSVGPVNPEWSGRHTRDVPIIRVIKPEDSPAPRTTGRSEVDATGILSASSATTGNRERVQSNAVYISSKPLSSLSPSPAHANSPSPAQGGPNMVSNESGIITGSKSLADRRKRLSKNRTSMSDWLATISAGNNTLVADHVATKASSVLRASAASSPSSTPPLSPTGSASSSESSTPGTPVEDFFLPPPMVEEIKTGYAPSDRRRRARCSYSGNEYEVVVAPSIPEDLLTEEIGVAC